MKKVYFICKKVDKKSCFKLKLNMLQLENKVIINKLNKLTIDKNSIYYFLKTICEEKTLKLLKKNNNILIYEPLDIYHKSISISKYIKKLSYLKHFDIIICNNHKIKEIYQKYFPNLKYFVIYHEFDIRLQNNNNILNKEIYYIGTKRKCSLKKKKIEKYDIKNINSFNKESYTGIHIDFLLKNNIYYYIHTSTKLSTSLYFNSIFICNRIPVYYEILGDEYPFYINDDFSNMKTIIKTAYEILNNKDEYNDYLENMKKYKIMLSPHNTSYEYKKIFNSI